MEQQQQPLPESVPVVAAPTKTWTCQEVADWFNLSGECLRHWEKIKRLKQTVSRTPGGHRRYNLDNVREIAGLMNQPVPPQALE